MAKAKAKPKTKAKATKTKVKAKVGKPRAKASKGKAKAKTKAAPKSTAKPSVVAKVNPTPKAKRERTAAPAAPVSDAAREPSGGGITPFVLAETSPGKFSLLLSRFDPADAVFEAAGLEAGGYAWGGIAKHVVDVVVPELAGRFGLDPEASMFVAYGEDRAALERLGLELARVFHDGEALAKVIEEIGADGFED